jgi:FAD/FMN-containing dehydrogenase
MKERYQSWGKYPKNKPKDIVIDDWRLKSIPSEILFPILPFGNGRSYGDVCQNENGTLLDTKIMNRFISFDKDTGVIKVEAGVLLEDILNIITPHGFFLPVVPGTQYVTVGGAIANDIHGKNHHIRGSFGIHVNSFEILTSDNRRTICSHTENAELFSATVGGLGLTGLIVWAEIKLMTIAGASIEYEKIPFKSINQFLELSEASKSWEYTVAWVDCLSNGNQLGRGIFSRGKHINKNMHGKKKIFSIPFTPPFSLINNFSLKLFNDAYYYLNSKNKGLMQSDYKSFFFPLDSIKKWNRIYGPKGFYQYQCVVSKSGDIEKLLKVISKSGTGSFLAVLKTFGDIKSPGLLSFPRPGLTLALDFPNNGVKTTELLNGLDKIVLAAGGTVYPAKDARLSSEAFLKYYPNIDLFKHHIDPKFSSSFWRRVTNEKK